MREVLLVLFLFGVIIGSWLFRLYNQEPERPKVIPVDTLPEAMSPYVDSVSMTLEFK